MIETLGNYLILFVILVAVIGFVSLINRSTILSQLFRSFGRLLLIFLQLFMLLIFTTVVSLLVALIIFIHPYLIDTPQFFANGEAIHLLAGEDRALLQFSFTCGILYIILFFISLRFLAKTRLTQFFKKIAKAVRMIVPYRRSHKNLESKLIGTACQLMASSIMLILYPVTISMLFANLEMTLIGNLMIFICLLIFSMVPLPGYANSRVDRTYSRRRPISKVQ